MRADIEAALAPVMYGESSAGYAVRAQLERDFAAAVSADHAIRRPIPAPSLSISPFGLAESARGDEVISVANSDISTTGAIHQCGATAVLCDVLASDYCMDAAQVETLITPRTRALLPVDMHGHSADVKALREIAGPAWLAHHRGTRHWHPARADYGRPLGAFADVAMYSFAPYKPLGSAGNGAMLVTNDAALAERIRLLVTYGAGGEMADGRQDYVAEGYNASLDPLQAALLTVKLPHLPAWTARRRAIVATLEAGLTGTNAITPTFRDESEPTFRSYCVRVPNQMEMHKGLREAGVESVIHYAPPVHKYSVYSDSFAGRAALPVTDMLAQEIVNLPVTPELTDDEVAYMIEVVRRLL